MDEQLKYYVKIGLIVLFAGLVAYGFITGAISSRTITRIFEGML